MEINRLTNTDRLSEDNLNKLVKILDIVEVAPDKLYFDLRKTFNRFNNGSLIDSPIPTSKDFIDSNYRIVKLFLIAIAENYDNPLGFNESNFMASIGILQQRLEKFSITSDCHFQNDPNEPLPPYLVKLLESPIDDLCKACGL